MGAILQIGTISSVLTYPWNLIVVLVPSGKHITYLHTSTTCTVLDMVRDACTSFAGECVRQHVVSMPFFLFLELVDATRMTTAAGNSATPLVRMCMSVTKGFPTHFACAGGYNDRIWQ